MTENPAIETIRERRSRLKSTVNQISEFDHSQTSFIQTKAETNGSEMDETQKATSEEALKERKP